MIDLPPARQAPRIAVYDLPPDWFPVTVEFYHWRTREVVHSVRVEAPEAGNRNAVRIPPLAFQLGHPVGVRVTYANGVSYDTPQQF